MPLTNYPCTVINRLDMYTVAKLDKGHDKNPGDLPVTQLVTSDMAPSPHPKQPTSTVPDGSCPASPAQPLDLLVAIVVFLLAPQFGEPELVDQLFSTPLAGLGHCHHLCLIQLVLHIKTCKSCYCWTAALIQRLWDMAWDLLTHHNAELLAFWAWPTQYV